jgi:hypothetical protein
MGSVELLEGGGEVIAIGMKVFYGVSDTRLTQDKNIKSPRMILTFCFHMIVEGRTSGGC